MKNLSELELIRSKIRDKEQLSLDLNRWKFLSKKIVFTNGCFDILHLGHIDYLSKAAEEGDVLIIGLNSDASTALLKGPNRPINSQDSRAMMLSALRMVTVVIIFDEQTPLKLIELIEPNVLVKGGDYNPDEIVGADIVKAKKGIVKTIPFLDGFSTTTIEEKIKSGISK